MAASGAGPWVPRGPGRSKASGTPRRFATTSSARRWWTAIVQSRAQVDASERSLRIAAENLEISTYSYREGLVTILDVLQAQLSWIQLYTNDLTARYNYALAISDYRRITAAE